MQDHKIIITGGAGLVGQNLVDCLVEQGCNSIVVVDKHAERLLSMQWRHPNITTLCADLAVAGEWQQHFEGAAAVVMLQAQISDLQEEVFIHNTLRSTTHVLHAIDMHRVPYLVHVSSSVVNSVADDLYTRSKRDQEAMVKAHAVPKVILRPTLMFGKYDSKHLGWLSRFMQRSPLFPIPGRGRFIRQPLYVRDFCQIIIQCLTQKITNQTYDITGLEKIDYIDMMYAVRKASKSKCLILPIPYQLFAFLLTLWALIDKKPAFTVQQLAALVAGDEFEVIDWPKIFNVVPTRFPEAIGKSF